MHDAVTATEAIHCTQWKSQSKKGAAKKDKAPSKKEKKEKKEKKDKKRGHDKLTKEEREKLKGVDSTEAQETKGQVIALPFEISVLSQPVVLVCSTGRRTRSTSCWK